MGSPIPLSHLILNYLERSKSRSLKVKCNHAIGLPIYGFLLRFTSNTWRILDLLWYIRLQNLSDLDIDLSRSHMVKCDGAVGLTICDFLLVFN